MTLRLGHATYVTVSTYALDSLGLLRSLFRPSPIWEFLSSTKRIGSTMGWFPPTARAAPPQPPSSFDSDDRDNDDSQRAWDESASGTDLDARPHGDELDETEDEDDDDAPEFASPDRATAIRAVRLLLLSALVIAGALVASSVYLLTARNLEQDEQVDVALMTRRVSRTVADRVVRVLGDMDLLAADIRLEAQESETSWPWVTVPRFEERASKVRRTHHLRKVILLPVVEEWSREMWGNFSVTSREKWFNESLEYYSLFEDHLLSSKMKNETKGIVCGSERHVNSTSTTTLSASQWSPPFVHDGGDDDGSACLVTSGQIRTAYQALSSGLASFGVEIPETAFDKVAGRSVDETEPVLAVAYPVVDPSSKVVAILLTTLPWNHLLEKALFEGEAALVSVSLPSDLQATMVFAVDQHGASSLGTSEIGNSSPQPHASISFIEEEWNARSDVVPVDGAESLVVRVDWVATTTTTSQNPTMYAVIVVLFFLFCIFLFVVYDRLVQQQRRQVMKHAKRNFRIVKSLFPAGVRDRLLEQQEHATTMSTRSTKASLETKPNRAASELGDRLSVADLEHGRDLSDSSDATRTVENTSVPGSPSKVMRASPKRRLRSFLRDRENFSGFTKEDDSASVIPSNTVEQKPIADLFPSCTILFADIAGFTAWSSERDPTQVFMLLGAIYAAFDKVARRRKVFKVRHDSFHPVDTPFPSW
jgi:Adenylate and Guanylate cyclase catalytic domain